MKSILSCAAENFVSDRASSGPSRVETREKSIRVTPHCIENTNMHIFENYRSDRVGSCGVRTFSAVKELKIQFRNVV